MDLQCARVAVPLDWKDPGGRTISLAVIRLRAKPELRIGTLFINPGGPADTGIGLVQGDPQGVASIGGGRFDVVSWDPRGTNASTRVPADQSLQAWPQVIGHLQQVGRLQGLMHGWWEWALCASWPVRGQDNYRGPWNRRTPNPILLINQTYDPNAGYANAVHAQQYLGNAVLLTHKGYGHLWFQDPSKCVTDAMIDYLVHLITPPPGKFCESNRKPFDPKFQSGT